MANVYISQICPDGIGPDYHPLENAVGIALHQAAVHVCSGVSFVAVTDDVFNIAVRFAGRFPLGAGGKSATSAPTQS